MKYLWSYLNTLLVVFLVSCGGGGDKITIYSPHNQELLEDVADRFEKETGIMVEFLQAGTDAVAERLRSEKARPQADIMYGGSAAILEILKTEGILAQSEPSWSENIPDVFVDKDKYWYGPMQTPAIIFYNTNNISPEDVPMDWFDLTNAKYKNKLQWLRSGGTASTFIAVIAQSISNQYGKEVAEQWLRDFDTNVNKYYNDVGLMYQDMNSPVGGISMFVLPYIADGIYNLNYHWGIATLKSGIINIIDVVAVIADSPNPEGAKKFMEWVGTKENQQILAQKFNRMPTDPEVLINSPVWMKEFNQKSMNIDWAKISLESREWMKIFENSIRSDR